MTEIRPIREEEAERFLHLLCDVFNLDYGRAVDVFFTEPMFDLSRKWALFRGREMVSILTTTPLEFGWGRAIGIAGVATSERHRRAGYAGMLIEEVLRQSALRGEGAALLFAREFGLYERAGFVTLDRVIRAPLRVLPVDPDLEAMEYEEVRATYDVWSQAHPARLRRDDLRWHYWQWHFRICLPHGPGYICHEPGTLRELILPAPQALLPIPADTEWFGLTSMASALGLSFETAAVELYLMGYGMPDVPQMFMTDQF